jgi:hypothetical protein
MPDKIRIFERPAVLFEGYLARFDAIFGLNQDLLLELQYQDHMPSAPNRRWAGLQKPGIIPFNDPSLTGTGDKHRRRWKPTTPPFTVDARLQPYFKLHGSSNWYTDDGRNLLVMGGNKNFMISQHQMINSGVTCNARTHALW